MTEYPNPQHYVRWETTYDLYNQIRTQLETFPASDAFLKQLIAKWRTIYKGPDITLGYLSSLIERFFAIYVSNLPIAAFLQTDSSLADIPLLDTIDIRKV